MHPIAQHPHSPADDAPIDETPLGRSRSAWFASEVQPHGPRLRSYLHRHFPGVRDVDDVVQESFLRLWRARATRQIDSAKAFLFTVARHIALDLVRRHRQAPFVDVGDLSALFVRDPALGGDEVVNRSFEFQLLLEAIDSLPGRCREIFILCQVEGLPQREVATRLGLSENTIAVQSARGLKKCAVFVQERLRSR